MERGLFITGTDTGVGKSLVAVGLIERLRREGRSVVGFKPVASGCRRTPDGLRNSDALALQAAASVRLPYEVVNPFAFEPPIAPHVAAAEVGASLTVAGLVEHYAKVREAAEMIVVEGAGGWRVPLGAHEDLADLAVALQLPVVLVVAIRLGCLNHALLTAESIRSSGVELHGWVANLIDGEIPRHQENIRILDARLQAPLLGVLPHLPPGASAAPYLKP